MAALPTGIVTFLFTDIEGSTRLLHELGDAYGDVQRDHFRLMREAVAEGGGVEVRTEGDAFFVVFASPAGAVRAVISAQRALADHQWAHGRPVRVRMGVHSGEGKLGGDDYLGIDVNRAARIAAAGHGGQVVLSSTTAALVERTLPAGVGLRDLGAHRLKDFDQPEHLHQLVIEGLPHEFPALKALDAHPTNLPAPRTSFVGRETEVAAVTEAVLKDPLVTLTGPGGTGKTRLALQAAAALLDELPDGAFFVDLSPIADPDLVGSAVAEALKVMEEPGRPLLDTVADHLQDRELVLVLDNFEQVTQAAGVVERLLDAAPEVRIMVTSREPLHLSGEREIPVPPLGLPDPGYVPGPEALSQFEAVALFIDRATAVRPEFRVTNENAPAVAELVARLDGLPLAVELAASRIKLLTPETILARLGQRLPLLTGGARDVPERQRTLRGAIEWSHDLLDDHERRLFARLSAFSGGWTLEVAEAVCGNGIDVLEDVGSLVDRSLVRRVDEEGSEPRFSMLETIREFAAEQLADSGEEAEIRRRHAAVFRDLAGQAEPNLTGTDPVAWLERLDREHDNLRAAIGWAIAADQGELGMTLAASIWRFWQHRGLLAEGRTWLERLLDLPSAEVRSLSRARALEALGSLAYWQNDYGPARDSYDEAESIARELGDRSLLARVLWDQSYMAQIDGDTKRSEAALREAQEAAEEAGDRVMATLVMADRGFYIARSDPVAARENYREAVARMEELGMTGMLPDFLGGLAVLEVQTGNLEEARRLSLRVTEMAAAAGSELGIGMALMGMAILANAEGRPDRAARLLGAEERLRQRVGGGAPPELQGEFFGDPRRDSRTSLGEEAYQRAYAEGAAMTPDQALAFARGD
jgi:predicted ATPase/class 3 adenylate cyclase